MRERNGTLGRQVRRAAAALATTLGVVSATHPAFADAVRAAMPGVRCSPAVRRGRTVRQVVHRPVLFDPEPGPRVSAPAAPARTDRSTSFHQPD